MSTGPLARLRFDNAASRGRRFPEPSHPFRNDFQRDRDRVIHARAFRRLEGKTQVFAPGLSDHFRNRLTHTIETSQISRTVAGYLGLNTDLTEALALSHDIGHPPFAHAGEQELNRLMQRFGESFDHNLHALRIVESFEDPYPRFPGLNLTFEVREGIVKHSRDLAPGKLDEYLPGMRPPLEAQLIDLCDEIAYNAADMDDGFAAGLIRMEDACAEIPVVAELYETCDTQFPGASPRVQMQEVVRGLINQMVAGLIEGTIAASQNVSDVRAHATRIASFTEHAGSLSKQLKRFLRSRVYESPEVSGSRDASIACITRLFEHFLAHPDRLPEGYQAVSNEMPLHHRIRDYLAGMTDTYLLRVHADLLG